MLTGQWTGPHANTTAILLPVRIIMLPIVLGRLRPPSIRSAPNSVVIAPAIIMDGGRSSAALASMSKGILSPTPPFVIAQSVRMRFLLLPAFSLFLLGLPAAAQSVLRQAQAPKTQARTPVALPVPAAVEQRGAQARQNLPAWWRNAVLDPARSNLPLIHEERALHQGTTGVSAHLADAVWKRSRPISWPPCPGWDSRALHR
jgi:hypothetical protein